MANRIKGLTVEIDGSTTGLDKALKNVNTTIKGTQTRLKDVQKLLKLDPSNTELLSQKQRLLKEAITPFMTVWNWIALKCRSSSQPQHARLPCHLRVGRISSKPLICRNSAPLEAPCLQTGKTWRQS